MVKSLLSVVAAGLAVVASVVPVRAAAAMTPMAPEIYQINPTRIAATGRQPVVIRGFDLTGASAVHVGSRWASDVTNLSGQRVTAVFPAEAAGTVSVAVVTDHGTSAAVYFTYVAVSPTSVRSVAAQWPTTGQRNDEPYDIDCASTTFCAAADPDGDTAVLQVLSGATWHDRAVPLPPDASDGYGNELRDVSCPAPHSCVAVGSYATDSVRAPLVTTLSGAALTSTSAPYRTPDPGLYLADLDAVSCTDISDCVMVGSISSGDALLYVLHDATITEPTLPQVDGDAIAELDKVACNATGCLAVGTTSGGAQVVLAGKDQKWKVVVVPLPGGGRPAPVSGIACSPDECAAVGTYPVSVDPTVSGGYLARYESSRWYSFAAPPFPPGKDTDSELDAVSCATDDTCVAIGPNNATVSYGGAANDLVSSEVPLPAGGSIGYVSCGDRSSCSVGGSGTRLFVDHLTPQRVWALTTVPKPAGQQAATTGMFGLSCVHGSFCGVLGALFQPDGSRLASLATIRPAPGG